MTAPVRPHDSATQSDRGGLEFGRLFLYGLALASLAAGIIHCSAALDHAHEHLPWHAFLFVVSAAMQIAWAGLILRRASKGWLTAGLLVNSALVVAWVASRSTGVPLIPGAQEVEPLGFKDVTSAFFELAVVIGVGLFAALPLAIRRLRLPAGRLAFEAMLTAVLLLVFFGLSQAPHSHSNGHGEEAALASEQHHHHDGDADHHDGSETTGHAHEAAADHGHDHARRTAAGGAEAIGSALEDIHDEGHVHDGGHVHASDEADEVTGDGAIGHAHEAGFAAADPHGGHHHDAPASEANREAPSSGGHSRSDSASAGSGHHHDSAGDSASATPGREREGHDHAAEPSGGSNGHGGDSHSGGHGHGDGQQSDPAPEELLVKAFFAFLNTITKGAGLGPV